MTAPSKVDLFVSFGVSGPRGFGIKQAILAVDRAPSTAAQVTQIRRWLQSAEQDGLTVAIISWQVLDAADGA